MSMGWEPQYLVMVAKVDALPTDSAQILAAAMPTDEFLRVGPDVSRFANPSREATVGNGDTRRS